MYAMIKKTVLKSIPQRKQYFVSSGVYTMREDMQLGVYSSKKQAKEELSTDLCFADLVLGKSGITADDYSIIAFSPLKYKPIVTHSLKVMLRKKAA